MIITQKELFLDVIKSLGKKNLLSKIMLVGSWTHILYKHQFNDTPFISSALNTGDLDFNVPRDTSGIPSVDIPKVLESLGFDSRIKDNSGWEVYYKENLEVEFITVAHRFETSPVKFKELNINAITIKMLDFLNNYSQVINYENLEVLVPEPQAYILHKALINSERTSREKKYKDKQAVIQIGEYLLTIPKEVERLKTIFTEINKGWQKQILKNLENISKDIHSVLK